MVILWASSQAAAAALQRFIISAQCASAHRRHSQRYKHFLDALTNLKSC